jgi:ribonuclease R
MPSKNKHTRGQIDELEDRILKALSQKKYVPQDEAGLAKLLELPNEQLSLFNRTLHTLERAGKIVRIKKNRFALPLDADLIPGRIRMNRRGQGTLFPDNPDLPQILIPPEATATALHDDRVLVRREVKPGKWNQQGNPTGSVIRVLERSRKKIVGSLLRGKQQAYVAPDDPRLPADIAVPPEQTRNIPTGHKVIVELTQWKSRHMSPEGRIVEVLGRPTEHGVDMRGILIHYRLPEAFPRAVIREARSFGNSIKDDDLRGRLDCRQHLVVTIDPDDAKDFDDAICVQKEEHGRYRLWVHIADVSYYVKPGSHLDKEALQRGNSTYLVDRVIPMLPEELSNELCSLKPHVDRLTKCAEFLIDEQSRVLEVKFHHAVINSKMRFSYQEAMEILKQSKPMDELVVMLHMANRIASKLRENRLKRGALNLEFPESKIRLDSRGRVLAVERVEHDESHQLIEELMLLTNEAVAKKLRRMQVPAVYRVHEPPDPEKLEELRALMQAHNIPCGDLSLPGEMPRLVQNIARHQAASALQIAVLRSMKRARYCNLPLGHYGLAAADYTHFTSPIRRYADLLVHRVLYGTKNHLLSQERLSQITNHISATERNSQDAERDSREIKMLAYFESQLSSRHPPVHEAVITEVRNFGFFVEIPSLAFSGLVPVSSLDDDLYRFDPASVRLVGRRKNRCFTLGQKVLVRVLKVERLKKQVDFKLAS